MTPRDFYPSGGPRVQATVPVAECVAAMAEYRAYAVAHPDDPIVPELLECAEDLEAELAMRRTQ